MGFFTTGKFFLLIMSSILHSSFRKKYTFFLVGITLNCEKRNSALSELGILNTLPVKTLVGNF